MEKIKEEKVINDTWMKQELEESTKCYDGERLPALKLEQGKITEIKVDFSRAFDKWRTTNNKGVEIVKAIIPVTIKGEKMIWWLNTKNPVYREILKEGKEENDTFKVIQIGSQADTKYQVVKE